MINSIAFAHAIFRKKNRACMIELDIAECARSMCLCESSSKLRPTPAIFNVWFHFVRLLYLHLFSLCVHPPVRSFVCCLSHQFRAQWLAQAQWMHCTHTILHFYHFHLSHFPLLPALPFSPSLFLNASLSLSRFSFSNLHICERSFVFQLLCINKIDMKTIIITSNRKKRTKQNRHIKFLVSIAEQTKHSEVRICWT